jgi:hypothetical protein
MVMTRMHIRFIKWVCNKLGYKIAMLKAKNGTTTIEGDKELLRYVDISGFFFKKEPLKRTYVRVTYVAMSPYGKPIVTAHTEKDLKAGLDEYYGIGKDSKAKYLDWTPYDSKYPDDFEGTYRYEVDDFNGGLELEEVKVYCVDFYPYTKYEVEDSI